MLATSNGGASDSASVYPIHSRDGPKSDFGWVGTRARLVGLSATGTPDPCKSGQTRTEDPASILTGLIEDLDPDAAALSKRLLKGYGSLSELYQSCVENHEPVRGAPPLVSDRLHHLARLLDAAFQREFSAGPVVSNFELLTKRLHLEMDALTRETFRVFFLNAENRLLSDRVMWEGSVRNVQVHPREVVRIAIETAATAVIFAHNHPSGNPTPSTGDIEITQKLCQACASVDVVVMITSSLPVAGM